MYTVVGDICKKCDTSSNIGNAVLYECICCVSYIYLNTKLLEAAAESIAMFLKSDSHNLKYMGIDALGRLIKISPDIGEQHQLAVIDCLEDPDDTLKRKIFDLLYKTTKSSSVEVIVDHMIDYVISINDNHYKAEIASRCVELTEQFALSNRWLIQTMNRVFEHAGDLVNIKVAHDLIRLIGEGFGEDDETVDSQLRSSVVCLLPTFSRSNEHMNSNLSFPWIPMRSRVSCLQMRAVKTSRPDVTDDVKRVDGPESVIFLELETR